MKVDKEEVPLIDLFPKLKRPLSLWNPLDYLRLLFWAFFFPQAIRWYVDKFVKPDYCNVFPSKDFEEFRKLINNDPILFNFIIQTMLTPLISIPLIYFILNQFNVPINWFGLGFVMLFGWMIGEWSDDKKDSMIHLTYEVVFNVLVNITGSITLGIGLSIVFSLKGVVTLIISIIVLIIITIIVIGIIVGHVKVAINSTIQFGRIELFAGSMAIIIFLGGVVSLFSGFIGGMTLSLKAILVLIIIYIRPLEYIMTTLYLCFFPNKKKIQSIPHLCRSVFIPLPGIQKQLENHLNTNWEKSVKNANQLLAYSQQYISVIKAIKTILEQSPENVILARISALTITVYDWRLFPALSLKSKSLYINDDEKPHLDTGVNAACAGFWFWHIKETEKALKAFAVVKNLQYGPELYYTAQAIYLGIDLSDIQTISSWEQEINAINTLQDQELRPGTLKALRILLNIARQARAAINTLSPQYRLPVINRAKYNLNNLIETGFAFCPVPEWPLIRDLAQKWKDIFTHAISEEMMGKSTFNPYEGYSGLAVTGSTFTGREDILRQIETHWTIDGGMPVLILYGQRRIGKTSILKSLANKTDIHTLYALHSMQMSSMSEHSGQIFKDIAEVLHKVVLQSYPSLGPFPENTDFSSPNTSQRYFESLLDRIATHMTETKRLILAIDESEVIKNLINKGKIDSGFISYLYSISQHYRWLGLMFAGLHNLEEMSCNCHFDFHDKSECIRVSYLAREDIMRLITNPHPDFSHKYEDALIDEIYRLAFGQPYLIQCLCWELVNRWNIRLLEYGGAIPQIIKIDDLAPVLTTTFFQSADYFDGVWNNVTKNEQLLMRVIARYENKPLSKENLLYDAVNSNFPNDSGIMDETLKLLIRHDIILENEIRFACELMRRWVLDQE